MAQTLKPTISFQAINKAAATLIPFVKYYFPIYNLSDRDFLENLTLFVCVEAAIYQADEEQEAKVSDATSTSDKLTGKLDRIITFLKAHDLFDEAIEQDLLNGLRYLALEKQMCRGDRFTHTDITDAIRFKCSDVRVLHRLAQKLTIGHYDEDLLAFLWISDTLVEIQYDLQQYTEDVERNVFNVYRMFLKLFKADGKAKLEEHIAALNAEAQARMLRLPVITRRKLQQALQAFRTEAPFPEIPAPIETDFG